MNQSEKILVGLMLGLALALGGFAGRKRLDSLAMAAGLRGPKLKQFIAPMDSNLARAVHDRRLGDPRKALFEAPVIPRTTAGLNKLRGEYRGLLRSEVLHADVLMDASIATVQTAGGVRSVIAGRAAYEKNVAPVRYAAMVRSLKGSAGQPDAAVLQISSDAVAQLFYVPEQDQWVGNYYRLEKNSEVRYLGTVQLIRRIASTGVRK